MCNPTKQNENEHFKQHNPYSCNLCWKEFKILHVHQWCGTPPHIGHKNGHLWTNEKTWKKINYKLSPHTTPSMPHKIF